MQPNWNAPEELIGDLAWQTKINLAGRLPRLPSPQIPSCSHTDYTASRAGGGCQLRVQLAANSPVLPPAFGLALQAPKRAQGQLVSTRQTGNLALPPPFGQLVDRQNGLLHSWEILGCRHPPPAQSEEDVTAPDCLGKWIPSAPPAGCSVPHQRSFSGMLWWSYFIYASQKI